MATATKKSSTKTKKLSLLKDGDQFFHTTAKGRKVAVTAVPVRKQLAERGTPASKNGVVIKARVKSGENAGKDRAIIEYRFAGGSQNYRYDDLQREVELVA